MSYTSLNSGQRAVIMEQVIDLVRKNPELSFSALSLAVGLGENRVATWYRKDTDGFKEKYDEALRECFNRLEGLAIKTLGDLLVDGNWNATKYVLDNKGYKAPDKQEIKAEVESQQINIVVE